LNLLNPYESAFPQWLFWSGIIHTIVEYQKRSEQTTQININFIVHIATKSGYYSKPTVRALPLQDYGCVTSVASTPGRGIPQFPPRRGCLTSLFPPRQSA